MLLSPPPSASDLAELNRLHAEARYLDAFRFAARFAALEEWADPTALVLAGRFAYCWGDWSQSNRLHTRAWRSVPTDPTTIYYRALTLENRHGPFEALRFLHEQNAVLTASEPTLPHSWLWLLQARLLSVFRDFEAAADLLRRAESVSAVDPWRWVEQARIFEQRDLYDEALASVQEALRMRPRYRPALESYAHLLMLLNRDEEALAVLQEANTDLQVGSLAQMHAILLGELERPAEVLAALDRATEWLPCANRPQRQWLASRRSDALRQLGRDAEAATSARAVKLPFHDHIAQRLAQAPAPRTRPVLLRVGFVRQHHMTCAPATLTALSRFRQRPVDHLELARLICYDGTPDHEERHWAESHGWLVREFRVTWEAAVALLDRGCPFTLTTVAPRSAHLQAVVGYDAPLGLLLIRDPYQRTHGEFIATAFLDGAASHGPRGLVLVPPERAELLAGLDLPDAALYDRWFRLRRAVLRHDRAVAQTEADALRSTAPDHRLTLLAERELALADGNHLRQLETTRVLLARFPDDPNLLLDEVQLLRTLGHPTETRARIAALVLRREPDALFLRESAELLAADARTHPRAHRLFRRVLRRRGVDAWNLRAFANFLWSRQQFASATEVYRLAACVGDKTEVHWDSFFSASRHVGAAEPCLALLRQREIRLGAQSGQPARTLFRAYELLDRTPDAFAMLEAALTRRPDDGELALVAAECHGRFGRTAESARFLADAAGRCPRQDWLRTAARLAEFRTEHTTALAHWRELLTFNPADLNAHGAVARLIAALEGRESALDFLHQACLRHSRLIPLHTLWLEWLRAEPAEVALPAVDQLLALDPFNAWALREKALVLIRQPDHLAALAAAEEAQTIEPHSPFSPGICGLCLALLGRKADARAAFEASLRLNPDAGYMNELVNSADDFPGRREAIAFIRTELVRQPAPDDGAVLRFRELARTILSPDETRTALEALLAAHPDRWSCWSALGTHLLEQAQLELALARARDAAERFPLIPRVWIDLAAAQSRSQLADAEITSLHRALELSPAWGLASRNLAHAHERALQLDAAEHVLRRALAADPLDPVGHGVLADLLWRRHRPAEARALLERALSLDPGYDWAWDRLDQWSQSTPDAAKPAELASALTRRRPGDSAAWLRLARLQASQLDDALATLDRALALDPRNVHIHDCRAQLLAGAGRHAEAATAARPAVFGETPPYELLGRAAWIEHARGRPAAAIAQLRPVVQAHPDYVWGWSCLTEWLWQTDEFQSCLDAASKWAWLAPWNSTPLGFVAAAHRRLGRRREAKDAFWSALRIDPAYTFGARTLLQLLAEDRDQDEAARLLRHIETHLTPADSGRAAVLYHLMARDRTAAGLALVALAQQTPADQLFLVQECAKALAEAGWQDVTETALSPLLADSAINPEIARLWVDAWAPAKSWGKLRRLEKISAPPTITRTAWSAALEHLGRGGQTWRLRWLCYRRREWLRADAQTWGSMSYALVTARLNRATVRWMTDWATYPDAKPWMLYNLVLAHYQRNEPAAAYTVIRHALTLPPDSLRPDFLTWSAFESALAADLPAATDALDKTAELSLALSPSFIRQLSALVVEFHRELPDAPRSAYRLAREKLDQLWERDSAVRSDPGLARFRTRVLRHLSGRSGRWLAHAASFLPSFHRGAPVAASRESTVPLGWILWGGFILLSALSRGCSGY